MNIRFDDINFDSRVWIYQANRALTDQEASLVNNMLEAAIDGWEAHNQPLLGAVKVFYNHFVVIAVDESHETPSGCSIDKSVHWLQELGARLDVDFFDRSVAYVNADKEVVTIPVAQVKQAIADEVIYSNTPVFDNLVTNKAQWMKRWKVPADQTWLKRYFEEERESM